MDNRPIGFIDSGIGGIPYLVWASDHLTQETFVYCADSAYFPYGNQSPEALKSRVVEVVGNLIARYSPKALVVACNTASVVALDSLRSTYDIPFVGVVPAVKPAAERAPGRPIALLASNRTVADDYTMRLIDAFASHCTVIRYAEQNLIDHIERHAGECGGTEIQKIVRDLSDRMKHDGIEQLVLGCTHFVFCADYFSKLLGPHVSVIDSREGVGRQLMRVIKQGNIEAESNGGRHSCLVETGGDFRLGRVAESYGLCYDGRL